MRKDLLQQIRPCGWQETGASNYFSTFILGYNVNGIASVKLIELQTVLSLECPSESLDEYLVPVVCYFLIQIWEKAFSIA